TTIDFLDVLDVEAPPIAYDLALIRQLAARLCVKRRFPQQHGGPAVWQVANGSYLCLDLHVIVADEVTLGGAFARRQLPLTPIGERIDTHRDLARLTLLLRSATLRIERRFEAGNVYCVTALPRH